MEIGAYLFVSGVLWLVGIALVARVREHLGLYSALGCLFPLLALSLYLFLPVWLGIYGTTNERPDPVSWHTYIERGGVIGIALLVLYLVGVFWPIFAAWIVNRRSVRLARDLR